MILDLLMADYHYTAHEAMHRVPLALALSLMPAARERRGGQNHGEDFADRAASAAIETSQTK